MDKKNTVFGVLLLIVAFVVLHFAQPPVPPPKPATAATAAASGATPAAVGNGVPVAPANAAVEPAPAPENNALFAGITKYADTAAVTKLANDFIEVHFTDAGGAIREVALKKYPAVQGKPEPFVFNALHADPMLAFVGFPGLDRKTSFQLVSRTDTEVVYRATLPTMEVTRRYELSPNKAPNKDPYQIKYETTFRNLGDAPINGFRVALAIGTAPPAHAADNGMQIKTGYSTPQGKQYFTQRAALDASAGFLGMGAHAARHDIASAGPLTWAAVKNQFFTSILTPAEVSSGLVTQRVKLFPDMHDAVPNAYGITASAEFDVKAIAAHEEAKLEGNFYVGPKEYRRLANPDVFKARQDQVMDFGFFRFFSQVMSRLMTWLHDLMAAPDSGRQWGLAIIFTTLTLKIVTLPLTIKAARSMRRMQKLGPEMKAIREKYKDNPQKQNAAMMELYKEHGVNPLGGCIPMLLPMPFFFGFYAMLQGTAELRFAPFLWAHDLSMPDTVGYIAGFPINILPLLLAATTIIQMQMTPQANLDKSQAMMMKFTPIIFLVICYNFSCALALYSTINGIFTIGQQFVINRMKDDGDPAKKKPLTSAPFGKPVKNVTPRKK